MLLVDYYRTAPDLVQFNQHWCPETTMLDKVKVMHIELKQLPVTLYQRVCLIMSLFLQGSLSCHAPKDQAYSQILEHVYSQLSTTHWGLICTCDAIALRLESLHFKRRHWLDRFEVKFCLKNTKMSWMISCLSDNFYIALNTLPGLDGC